MDCGSAATQGNDVVAVDEMVCSPPKKRRKAHDEEGIIMDNELTDVEINFAQQLLKHNLLPLMDWSQLCINSYRKMPVFSKDSIRNRIQILFCKECKHWIVATTVNCSPNKVKVYDCFNT